MWKRFNIAEISDETKQHIVDVLSREHALPCIHTDICYESCQSMSNGCISYEPNTSDEIVEREVWLLQLMDEGFSSDEALRIGMAADGMSTSKIETIMKM